MRLVLLITCLFIGISVFAQDIIVTKKGEEIESKVVEVGLDNIKYKKFNFLDGPNYVIRKGDVVFIKYENGTKEIYATEDGKDGIDSTSRKGVYLGLHATPGMGRMIHRLSKYAFSFSTGYDVSFYFNNNIGFKTGLTYTHFGWGSDAEFRRYDQHTSWPRTYQTRDGYVRGEVEAIGVPIHFLVSTGDKLGFYLEYGINLDFVMTADRKIDYFENETYVYVDVFGGSNERFNRNNLVLSSNVLAGVIYKKSNKLSYKLGLNGYYSIADFIAYEENSNGLIFGLEFGVNLRVGH